MRCSLRTEEWAPAELTIVVADLIEQEVVTHVPDLAVERARGRGVDRATRVAVIAAQRGATVAPDRAATATDVRFVAGCDAHA